MTGPEDTYGDGALAAEYVLRLLEETEQDAFEARLRDEPELRALVAHWERQFAALAEGLADEPPPARLRALVLGAAAGTARRDGWLAGLRQRPMLRPVLALALVAAVAVGLFVSGTQERFATGYRAELASDDRSVTVLARSDASADRMLVEVTAGTPPPGRVFELWLIAEGAPGPVSLGVLDAGGRTRITVPRALLADLPASMLAISDEPPGGSPTGSPTGTVVAVGPVEKI